MAEIHLCAMADNLGCCEPAEHRAWINEGMNWKGGESVKKLMLRIGDSTITIWPADPDRINSLGDELKSIANELRDK